MIRALHASGDGRASGASSAATRPGSRSSSPRPTRWPTAGVVPAEDARDAAREARAFDIARIDEIEQTTQHDVIAFTTAVAEQVGPVGALAALRPHLVGRGRHRAGAADARGVRPDPDGPRRAARRRSRRAPTSIARTPMIGRTHGVHAEPMTFGLKLALWYAELQRDTRARRARARGRRGRQDLRRRRHVRAPRSVDRSATSAARLGLTPAPVSSQVIQRDRHAELLTALAILGRVAREVRARDPRPAEDRDRRSRGAVRQGAEGLVGDAAQAQSDRLRADRRPGAPDPRQRDGGARERRALARARHLALVGRARDSARQLHRARSHAAPLHAHRRRHGGVSRADAARTSRARAAWCFRAACCSSWRAAASRASRPTSGCSATRCARSTSSATSRRCCWPTPTSRRVLPPATSSEAFDLDVQLRNVDAIFDARVRGVGCRRRADGASRAVDAESRLEPMEPDHESARVRDLKPSVFDPQGHTIAEALHSLGYGARRRRAPGQVLRARRRSAESADDGARRSVARGRRRVLANPVHRELSAIETAPATVSEDRADEIRRRRLSRIELRSRRVPRRRSTCSASRPSSSGTRRRRSAAPTW